MRSTEEAYGIYNYFDPSQNKNLHNTHRSKNFKPIQINDRSYAM